MRRMTMVVVTGWALMSAFAGAVQPARGASALSVTKDAQFEGAGEFINSGGGLSSLNFQVATAPADYFVDEDLGTTAPAGIMEIGLRIRNASDGTPPGSTINGNVYTVQAGTPFQFDYQFAYIRTNTNAPDDVDFLLALSVDFDPSPNIANKTLAGPVFLQDGSPFRWNAPDRLFENGQVKDGTAPWNTSDAPYIVGNSWNLNNDTLALVGGADAFLPYNPGVTGLYTITLHAFPLAGPEESAIFVTAHALVVPLPAAVWAGMVMLGGMGGVRAWRRRRAA